MAGSSLPTSLDKVARAAAVVVVAVVAKVVVKVVAAVRPFPLSPELRPRPWAASKAAKVVVGRAVAAKVAVRAARAED